MGFCPLFCLFFAKINISKIKRKLLVKIVKKNFKKAVKNACKNLSKSVYYPCRKENLSCISSSFSPLSYIIQEAMARSRCFLNFLRDYKLRVASLLIRQNNLDDQAVYLVCFGSRASPRSFLIP